MHRHTRTRSLTHTHAPITIISPFPPIHFSILYFSLIFFPLSISHFFFSIDWSLLGWLVWLAARFTWIIPFVCVFYRIKIDTEISRFDKQKLMQIAPFAQFHHRFDLFSLSCLSFFVATVVVIQVRKHSMYNNYCVCDDKVLCFVQPFDLFQLNWNFLHASSFFI